MNQPQFKIFGEERRELKKELSKLKLSVRYFWHFHNEDKFMTQIYGGNENYPMSDDVAQQRYDKKLQQINYLESKLQEPHENLCNN